MWAKLIAVVFLVFVTFNLFRGLYFLVKDQGATKRTVNSLTLRVAFSLALFVFLMIAFATGWIQPHGVGP